MSGPAIVVAGPQPLRSIERRWAVKVTCYYNGKLCDGCPFLAGRFYFEGIRTNQPGWRVSATPVKVTITTVEVDS